MNTANPPSRKTVALVLGGGSSRGWVRIGAIEALEEEGIPVDYISGCSVDSYVVIAVDLNSGITSRHFSR